MNPLRLLLVQSDPYWEDPVANLAALEELLWQHPDPVDVIVLPEMFQTGFTTNGDVAEVMGLHTTRWMRQQAARTGAAVVGSFLAREAGHLYHRLLWVEPDGQQAQYNKRHLFRISDEAAVLSPGGAVITHAWRGWRVRFIICYDLRFPVWCRNVRPYYDVLLC
ncbi:MAG: nitrilase-related carbon-nitrogen hydrolase, partial [Catalinimonas sp.]